MRKTTDKDGFAVIKQPSSGKKRREEDSDQTNVLTFVDMSKLRYLSRSVNAGHKLERKVELPSHIGNAIEEAPSEEDSDDNSDKVKPDLPPKTSKDVATEIINELLGIVFDSATDTAAASGQIASNTLIQKNVHKLHK